MVRKYTPKLQEHYSSVAGAIAFLLRTAASLRAGRLDIRVMVNAKLSFWHPEEAGCSLGQSTFAEIDQLCDEWNRRVQEDGKQRNTPLPKAKKGVSVHDGRQSG